MAPLDGSVIFGETFDGFRLLVKWADGFLNEEGGDCGCWVAADEYVHPADWSDGVCWSSNEDGNPGDPLVKFISPAAIAETVADSCVYKRGTDNYARVYQGALLGTLKAFAGLASGIEAATADETQSGSAVGESPAAESRDAQGQSV